MSESTIKQTAPAAPRIVAEKALGANTSCPFPIVERAWDMFGSKGIKTVFVSVGSSASALPDLELAESLGCPIHAVPLNSTQREAWAEVATILKERKRLPEVAKHEFSKGAETKWILPKNIRVSSTLPWWCAGTADISGVTLQTEQVYSYIEKVCKEMKLKDNQVRLDILKVDVADIEGNLEVPILEAFLHAGFRPGIVLVNWSRMPDIDLMVTTGAGHLQNCGYRLVGKNGPRFLYFFTDNDMYQICSWENDKVANPLVMEILRAGRDQLFTPPVQPAAAAAEKSEAATEEASTQ